MAPLAGLPSALPPAFPREILIPPHRGAGAFAIELAIVPPARSKVRPTPKRKKKPAQRRRKTSVKARAAPAPVIALPHCPEPLIESKPAIDLAAWSALAPAPVSVEPLPAGSRAIAVQRGGGLLGALADWLGSHALQLMRRLGAASPPRRRFRPRLAPRNPWKPDDEVQRLRAENERLRRQLEALLALQNGASGKPATSPA